MPKRKHRQAKCPSCHQTKDLDNQKGLRRVEKMWVDSQRMRHPNPNSSFHPLEDGMRLLAARGHNHWFWACDSCLASGKAIEADIRKHNIGLGTSFAAYVERPFICEDCQKPSMFSPSEQQYWFETLQFLIWVYPKQCAACRKKRRHQKALQKQLQQELATLDPNDANQLFKISELYEQMGIESKATIFHNRGTNQQR